MNINLDNLDQDLAAELKVLISDPEALSNNYSDIKIRLQGDFPRQDFSFYSYWAARLALLGYTDKEITDIGIAHPFEPTDICIQIKPDMGS